MKEISEDILKDLGLALIAEFRGVDGAAGIVYDDKHLAERIWFLTGYSGGIQVYRDGCVFTDADLSADSNGRKALNIVDHILGINHDPFEDPDG